jgi:hypothetical protein
MIRKKLAITAVLMLGCIFAPLTSEQVFSQEPSPPAQDLDRGGWPTFKDHCVHHSHRGCPILAFFARVGGDAACAI